MPTAAAGGPPRPVAASGRRRAPRAPPVESPPPPSEPLVPGIPLTRADVEAAVRSEGAMTADDVLDRRSRVGLVDEDRARCADPVATLVARIVDELG